MALPESEWLHLAKRTSRGGSSRHLHLRERRPNLVVKNLDDRYTAYCMACKQGAVHLKEHVRVTGIAAPVGSTSLILPTDMTPLGMATKDVLDGVLGFLAHKNMDAQYIERHARMFFSRSRMRLILQFPEGYMGRDTTERSPQKWLTFDRQTHLSSAGGHRMAVVVEDPFSFLKARWALLGWPIDVYSSLGTQVPDALAVKLLAYDTVAFFYDGDTAGYKGADTEAARFRAFGVTSFNACAPAGKDPKDMTIEAIREWVDNF
jgi:hypothetical protein